MPKTKRRCAQCKQPFTSVKPWQRHCSAACRKLTYEHTAAGKRRTLRYSSSKRRRLTRAIKRMLWVRDYRVSGLRDGKSAPQRETTQHDLRQIRWKRLPLAYRQHAESNGLADKRLLAEWRKFWNAQIKQARMKMERTTGEQS